MIESIKENLSIKKRLIVGIDGRCAAGKTTISEKIAKEFDGSIIHMDDFFLPKELRTKERLEEVGGNVHYERFLLEVCQKFKSNDDFSYRVFSCKTMDYVSERFINNNGLIIIEGAYSLKNMFREIYDMAFFMDVDRITQKERIIARGGDYDVFSAKWIPLEEKYIINEKPNEFAKVIDTQKIHRN